MSLSPNLVVLGLEIPAELFANFPKDDDAFKNLRPNDRSVLDDAAKMICPMYIEDKSYKSGRKEEYVYKACCEWYSYCSFTNQIWFWPACIGAGFILFNVISIVLLCLICRKKGGRPSGGLDVEEKTVEEIIKDAEDVNDDN